MYLLDVRIWNCAQHQVLCPFSIHGLSAFLRVLEFCLSITKFPPNTLFLYWLSLWFHLSYTMLSISIRSRIASQHAIMSGIRSHRPWGVGATGHMAIRGSGGEEGFVKQEDWMLPA